MWNIIRINGDLTLISLGEPIPSGGVVIGQTIDPNALTPPVEPVPTSVTRFQARAALAMTVRNGASLFVQIEAIMSSLEPTDIRRRAWEDALDFERDSITLTEMALALGLADNDLDDLFRLAKTIKA